LSEGSAVKYGLLPTTKPENVSTSVKMKIILELIGDRGQKSPNESTRPNTHIIRFPGYKLLSSALGYEARIQNECRIIADVKICNVDSVKHFAGKGGMSRYCK
jgi:hypothetical protein